MTDDMLRINAAGTIPAKRITPKKLRRRTDGSLVLPQNPDMPTKTIYMIRHGQSQGQVAKHNGWDRKKDQRLLDCGLTKKGESEAMQIGKLFSAEDLRTVELVVSSPLTRALHTALLGFPNKNMIVNYDLREIGSKVPENVPRDMKQVMKDLRQVQSCRDTAFEFDLTSLQPDDWPRDFSPSVIKKERIKRVLQWLYHDRNETVFVLVCHYNVIRSAVTDGQKLRPINAIPIRCTLHSNGDVVVEG